MVSNLIVCLRAVFPLMILLAIGALVRRSRLLTDEEVSRMNHMVFVVFFPALMFDNLYSSHLGDVFDLKLLLYALVLIFVTYGLSIPPVFAIQKDPKSRGAMIQAIYRSNFILMGLPVSVNILGAGNVGYTAMLMVVVVPVYNVLAVFTLEYFRGGKADVKDALKKIATNPIILGAVAAMLCMALHVSVPTVLDDLIGNMSAATTPIALILLGASFDYKSAKRDVRSVAFCVAARLILAPALGLGVGYLLGFEGAKLVALLSMTAAPAAVSSYTMASAMDSNAELAGDCVIFGTPLSCLTMFCWLFLLKSTGLI